MARYGMLIDIKKCTGCYNCFLSCKDEYAGNDYPPYSEAQPLCRATLDGDPRRGDGLLSQGEGRLHPLPCQQCREAPCINSSPPGAVYRRPDGIVLIDPKRSRGLKEIISLCPHRVIFWNEEKKIPRSARSAPTSWTRDGRSPLC